MRYLSRKKVNNQPIVRIFSSIFSPLYKSKSVCYTPPDMAAPAEIAKSEAPKRQQDVISRSAQLISDGVFEASPLWLNAQRKRFFTNSWGWGSELAATINGDTPTDIRVGHKDWRFNLPFPGLMIKRGLSPQPGVRFGDSDKVYRWAGKIEKQLRKLGDEGAKDAVAPVLYELARRKGSRKLTSTTIREAKELHAETFALVPGSDPDSKQGVLFLTDPNSDKVMKLFLHTTQRPTQDQIEELREEFIGDKEVQRALQRMPSQAVSIIREEREDRVYAHITGAGGEQYREILLSTSPREGVVRRGQEAVVAPVSEAEPDVVAVADSPAEFGEHHDPLPAGPVALGSASVAEAALDASNQDAKEARVLHEGDVIDQGISRGYRPYKAGENEPLATLAYTDTLTGEKLRDLATQTVQDPERADIDAIEEFITARATVVVDGKPVEIRGEHAEKVYLNPKIMSLEDAREIEEIGDAGIARYLEEYPVEEGKAYHDVPVFVTRNNVV